MANSRVGVTTNVLMCFVFLFEPTILWIKLIIGMAKAPVFPVPVCAQATKSNPSKTAGMACSWIGVGLS